MKVRLTEIGDCFEGGVPSIIASCDAQGVPNVTFLSVVHHLEEDLIGLSFQFFNKTRRNIAVNPVVRILFYSPTTGAGYWMLARFLHSETEGPRFDRMAASISGTSAISGAPDTFKLAGLDVYRVLECDAANGHLSEPVQDSPDLVLRKVGQISRAIGACEQVEEMIDTTLRQLAGQFGFNHSMVLIPEPDRPILHALASHGYANSGIGAEVRMGVGIIGQAAAKRQWIRIGQWTRERLMGEAIGQRLREAGQGQGYTNDILLPGLENVESMLALPMLAGNRLMGVLYLESEKPLSFRAHHGEALEILANQLAAGILAGAVLATDEGTVGEMLEPGAVMSAPNRPTREKWIVKRYEADNSVFIGHDYLIKGVAGAILWVVLEDFITQGRTDFNNRELRADPRLVLPDVVDNLEARLILLRRRLDERDVGIRLEKAGRGRFRLRVDGALHMRSIPRPP